MAHPGPTRHGASVADQSWWKRVQRAAEDVKSGRWVDGAKAAAENAAANAQVSAQRWAHLFHRMYVQPEDAGGLAESFGEALDTLDHQLDNKCNAVAVGLLRRAGAGLSHVSGFSLTYVRPDGPIRAQLRFSEVSGRSAALALGTGAGGFAACLYGPRSTLLEPLRYRGADAGILVASFGLFQARAAARTDRATGWIVGAGAGIGLGVPFISDISGFDWEEYSRSVHALSKSMSEPIEARIVKAKDRRIRRRAAQVL